MNRPFAAFSALLLALAIAMIAVSSTSRSTTVRQSAADIADAAGSAADRPAASGTMLRNAGNYVVVLPLGEGSEAVGPEVQPTYIAGCGLDRTTGRVYWPASTELSNECCVGLSGECWGGWECEGFAAALAGGGPAIKAAQVTLAEFDAVAWQAPAQPDDRTHYDADYDRCLYGETVREPSVGTAPQSPLDGWQASLRLNVRWLLLGVQNRLATGMDQLGWTDDWQWSERAAGIIRRELRSGSAVDWKDYSTLMNDAIRSANPADRWPASSGAAKSTIPVRSGRWLLLFAASSLDRASELLSGTAEQLQQAAENAAQAQVADQSSAAHR